MEHQQKGNHPKTNGQICVQKIKYYRQMNRFWRSDTETEWIQSSEIHYKGKCRTHKQHYWLKILDIIYKLENYALLLHKNI